MKRLSVLLLTAAMAVLPVVSHAQWQWVDKDGRKVFSDQPPPFDIPEKNVLKSPRAYQNRTASNAATAAAVQAAASAPSSDGAPKIAGSPPPALARDKDLEDRKKAADDEAAAKKKAADEANAKARAENCRLAREGKAQMDSGVRVARVNKAGEREIMDDAAREAETKRLQGVINSECSVNRG